MQDAFLKHQRIVVMKLKRVSQLTLGLFFASQLFYTAQAAPPKNQQPPNIMIILADDLGFSDISAYGGEIKTPHIDSLLKQGKMLFNFHASSMCSPTRAQLMTGADNHLVGLGACMKLQNDKKNWLAPIARVHSSKLMAIQAT